MLGTRIAALRREAGLSQAELAQRLQVSPSALGMYEQERREPSMQTLVKLSRELGVTTDYLLTGTPAEKERAELEGMLISGWSSAGSVPSPGKSWRSCLPPC
ncbi:MAG: hypothetical protein BHW31_04485 [Firmicutes bacterium CAG:110_56_8]|nr:MAG: hypothetical protein BHW31_04485 [Firmicutes bacterium CAG:110_56_8]